VLRHQGRICALAERCAHQGGPLSEGELQDGTITCPWHGSTFRVDDGSVVHGPSTFDQPCYETRVRDGFIEVKPRT
jgi:nitrite reductase/ring-hydroxylating ferredoxin subunit